MVISSRCTPYGASRGSKRPLQRVDVGAVGGVNVKRVKRERHPSVLWSVRKLK